MWYQHMLVPLARTNKPPLHTLLAQQKMSFRAINPTLANTSKL
jgi:hypothetical protein